MLQIPAERKGKNKLQVLHMMNKTKDHFILHSLQVFGLCSDNTDNISVLV